VELVLARLLEVDDCVVTNVEFVEKVLSDVAVELRVVVSPGVVDVKTVVEWVVVDSDEEDAVEVVRLVLVLTLEVVVESEEVVDDGRDDVLVKEVLDVTLVIGFEVIELRMYSQLLLY